MALFQKKSTKDNPVAALEAELTATRRKRDDLATRRDRLAYAHAEAEQAQKAALLIDDDSESQAALDKAAVAHESCASSLRGIGILLTEHDAKISDLELQISTGLDRQKREAKAAKLDQLACTIEVLCREHAEVVGKLNAAHGEAVPCTPVVSLTPLSQLVAALNVASAPAYEAAVGNLRSAANLLRNPPTPKRAPDPEPPPPGEWSGHKRKFSHGVSPGAVGDNSPRIAGYYAEKT